MKKVIIPKTVTTVCAYTFAGKGLKEIIIPDTVTFLGSSAFAGNRLEKVEIPSSITTIASHLFEDNNKLTEVVLPETITIIGKWAFSNNRRLQTVTIPNSVRTIQKGAFDICALKTVNIPNRVTTIGEDAFRSNQIEEVTIPPSVQVIGNKAFRDNKLKKLQSLNTQKYTKKPSIQALKYTDGKAQHCGSFFLFFNVEPVEGAFAYTFLFSLDPFTHIHPSEQGNVIMKKRMHRKCSVKTQHGPILPLFLETQCRQSLNLPSSWFS